MTIPRLLPAVLLALPAGAQEVRCLLAEGDPLPGLAGHTVSSLSNTAANQLGGWAATVNSSDGIVTSSTVWGAASFGGDGAPLQTEGTIAGYEQTSFESFFGVDDAGTSAYGPTCTDTSTGASGLDAVWLGDVPVAIEDDPIPTLPGKVWRFNSRPSVTRDGEPFWVGGIDDAATGTNEGEGLFRSLGATPVLTAGDLLPGAPAAIASSGIDFDYAVSAYGTHVLTGVQTTLSSTEDYVVVLDGAALLLGGLIVQEDQPLPGSVGGLPGEVWDNFDFYGVNEAGDVMITGDTGGPTDTDEFVLRNGVIALREGDVLDGRVLAGAIEGASMNANGEIAFVWDVEDPGGDLEALFFEDQLLLLEGDPVDVTGDGVPDPGATVANFTGIAATTLGPDRTVYVTADVDLFGTSTSTDDVECLLAATPAGVPDLLASPQALSVSLGGDQSLFLDAGPALAGQLYLVAGSLTGTAPGIPFEGFTVPLNPDFYFFLTVNKPNVPPLVDTLGNLDAEGRALAQWQLPAGALPGLAGVTADHAYVVVDAGTLAPLHVSTTASLAFVP